MTDDKSQQTFMLKYLMRSKFGSCGGFKRIQTLSESSSLHHQDQGSGES